MKPDLNELYKDYSPEQIEALAKIIAADMAPNAFASVPQCRIHETAIIHETSRPFIWDGARILAGVVIGKNCSVGGGTEIGRGSYIGDRSRIGANCFLPSNTRIGEQVFVGPGCVMTDDKYPRVPNPGDPPYHAQPPTIGSYAVIGAACIIMPGVTIGEYAFVAAGSIVTRDVQAHDMVLGAPARIVPVSKVHPTRQYPAQCT